MCQECLDNGINFIFTCRPESHIAILNDLGVGLRGETPLWGRSPQTPYFVILHFTCDRYIAARLIKLNKLARLELVFTHNHSSEFLYLRT